MRKYIPYILSLMMVVTWPALVLAQEEFDAEGASWDILSVEALIANHKTARTLLLSRSTLEACNTELHATVESNTTDYREVNKSLDKYTRAFDVIDLLLNTCKTAFNSYTTYKSVEKRISNYKDLLSEYNDKILKRGKVVVKDTLIFSIAEGCIEDVSTQVSSLCSSLYDLLLFSSGAMACSTKDLMTILERVNNNLDGIKSSVDKSYKATFRYIKLRAGYWTSAYAIKTTKQEIIDESMSRWKASAVNALNKK